MTYTDFAPTKVCILNDFLTLKLEDGKTNIYVGKKMFMHCKYLLLNLVKEDFPDYDEIENIDEAIKIYSRENEYNKTVLDPDTEFIGHCSNLQAWVEYGYDLRVLHTNLAFPLLRELAKVGDKRAEIVLKEEIIERINCGNDNVFFYLVALGCLRLFTYEELQVLFDVVDDEHQDMLKVINKLMNERYIVEKYVSKYNNKVFLK